MDKLKVFREVNENLINEPPRLTIAIFDGLFSPDGKSLVVSTYFGCFTIIQGLGFSGESRTPPRGMLALSLKMSTGHFLHAQSSPRLHNQKQTPPRVGFCFFRPRIKLVWKSGRKNETRMRQHLGFVFAGWEQLEITERSEVGCPQG